MYLVMVEVIELGGVMVIVRTEFEQMGQRREQEQQHFEQYLFSGARADQQWQQEYHFDLDQFNDQQQSHSTGQQLLLKHLLCNKKKKKLFNTIRVRLPKTVLVVEILSF